MKKVVLFSSILGVALFVGSVGRNTAHADSSTANVTTSVSSSSNNATSSSVSGTDDTSASSAGETAISSEATRTSSENSDRVEYGVGTVEQAIEEADLCWD